MKTKPPTNIQMSSPVIPVTSKTPEPPAGTVVMLNGLTGTAYQRHYKDGRFHGTNGRTITWDTIKSMKRHDTFIILMGVEE